MHEAWLPREHALHRPRHGGRQLTALLCALVFFATPTLLWVFGARAGEIENHKLAGFPSITDGWGFFTGMPAWATDHLAFRGPAIDAADAISKGLFGEPAPFDQGGKGPAGPLPDSQTPATGGQGKAPDSQAGYRRVIRGTDGWLYFGYDTDAKCSPVRPIGQTVERLNALRAAVEASGRQFVFVIAPDKTTMVPEHLPASYSGKECAQAAAPEFWRRVTQGAGALDLRPELNAAARQLGHPVYFAKDTHWTDAGGMILTRSIAERLQPGIASTWRSSPAGEFSVDADLPPMLGRSAQKTGTYYALRPNGMIDRTIPAPGSIKEPLEHTDSPMESTINAPTLILGDSFTLASARYLPAGFSDVTMLSYTTVAKDAQIVIDAMAASDVVALQVVERGVASGNLPILNDEFVAQARTALAAQPR